MPLCSAFFFSSDSPVSSGFRFCLFCYSKMVWFHCQISCISRYGVGHVFVMQKSAYLITLLLYTQNVCNWCWSWWLADHIHMHTILENSTRRESVYLFDLQLSSFPLILSCNLYLVALRLKKLHKCIRRSAKAKVHFMKLWEVTAIPFKQTAVINSVFSVLQLLLLTFFYFFFFLP